LSKPRDAVTAHKKRAQRTGRLAEALARLYLRATGHRVVAHNLKTPCGEIDIVARRGNVLCFVEVKSRADRAAAAEAVTPRQRGRIERAARHFLAARPELCQLDVRFDVALVRGAFWLRYVADAWRPG